MWDSLRDEFESTGRLWVRKSLSDTSIAAFDMVADLGAKVGKRLRPGPVLANGLSNTGELSKILSKLAPSQPSSLVPVRVIAFNKTQDNNWGVPWHQDRVIAVAERHDVVGFGNWSQKSGLWHCEPPVEILDQMFFVRIHLDDADKENGVMRIAVGSHQKGVVPVSCTDEVVKSCVIEDCVAMRGDILILKMLMLHSSLPSKVSIPRRVLRVDYAPSRLLPKPLEWTAIGS